MFPSNYLTMIIYFAIIKIIIFLVTTTNFTTINL